MQNLKVNDVEDSNKPLQQQIKDLQAKHESMRIQHQAEMKELKDKATKDLKDAVARYEQKVQELSNQIELQQSSLAKPSPPVTVPPQPVPSLSKPLSVAIVEILDKSECARDPQEIAFLKTIMGNKAFVTYMLFKGSRDGWYASDFHTKCDGKGPTITLLKMVDGACIGGFTSAQWSSPSEEYGVYVEDKSAVLFNLTTRTRFPVKNHSYAINCDKNYGPVFGQAELGTKEPFNGTDKCYSLTNYPGYEIPVDSKGMNSLVNNKAGFAKFTISELEVWEIRFTQ